MFSVVIPTFNRRDTLMESLQALERVEMPWPCEVVVVDDGSSDGTADALAELEFSLPLTVVSQENSGAAAARNLGAAHAAGKYLLFLDDDMTADRQLLVEHEKVLSTGATAVVGNIPLHPGSPRTLLSLGVGKWTRQRHERLVGSDGVLGIDDMLTGQLSVSAEAFNACGRFDASFTAGGEFGGEDTDLGYRLLAAGCTIRYAPDAISHQRYVVETAQLLRQRSGAGRADAMLALKHPAMADELATRNGGRRWAGILQLVTWVVPRPIRSKGVAWTVARVESGHTDPPTSWAFRMLRDRAYWHARAAVGEGKPLLRVLAYHDVNADSDGPSSDYAVTAAQLRSHLTTLRRAGFAFIGLDEFVAHVEGKPVAEPSILLTFDDAYHGVLDHAAPMLQELGIPAVVFVVSSQIGGWNSWDAPRPADGLTLMSAAELRTLHEQGWAVESHTRTHANLRLADDAGLSAELREARTVIGDVGVPLPRMLAYPYGDHDRRVRRATRRAGYWGAFALTTTRARSTIKDRYLMPRIEVKHDTSASALLRSVLSTDTEGRRSALNRELRGIARQILGRGKSLDLAEEPSQSVGVQ